MTDGRPTYGTCIIAGKNWSAREVAGEFERLEAAVKRLRGFLREIEEASRDDDSPTCQHYCWINDTAKEALLTGESERLQAEVERLRGLIDTAIQGYDFDCYCAHPSQCCERIGKLMEQYPETTKDIGEQMADEYVEAETEHMRGRETVMGPLPTKGNES